MMDDHFSSKGSEVDERGRGGGGVGDRTVTRTTATDPLQLPRLEVRAHRSNQSARVYLMMQCVLKANIN